MPVDYSHAFAEGPTGPKPSRMALMLARFCHAIYGTVVQRVRIAGAWRQFSRLAQIADGCLLGPNAWCTNPGPPSNLCIGPGCVIRGVIRCENWHDARLTLGRDVYVGDDCIISCAKSIEIGDFTMISHNVHILDNDSHPVDAALRRDDWRIVKGAAGSKARRPPIASSPVVIGSSVWLGFGVAVLRGVTIGEGAVVGALSVVANDLPAHSMAAGNPAKVIRALRREVGS